MEIYFVKSDGCKGKLYVEVPQTITSSLTLGEVNSVSGSPPCFKIFFDYLNQNLITTPRLTYTKSFQDPSCAHVIANAIAAYNKNGTTIDINPTATFNPQYSHISNSYIESLTLMSHISYNPNNNVIIIPNELAATGTLINNTNLSVVNDNPAIAFTYKGAIQYVRSTDMSGTNIWNPPLIVRLESENNFKLGSLVTFRSFDIGKIVPAIVYIDETYGTAWLSHSIDPNGNFWLTEESFPSIFTSNVLDISATIFDEKLVIVYLSQEIAIIYFYSGFEHNKLIEANIGTGTSPHIVNVDNIITVTWQNTSNELFFQQFKLSTSGPQITYTGPQIKIGNGGTHNSPFSVNNGTLPAIAWIDENNDVKYIVGKKSNPESLNDFYPAITIYSNSILTPSSISLSATDTPNILITGEIETKDVMITRGSTDGIGNDINTWQAAQTFATFNPGMISLAPIINLPAISYFNIRDNLLKYALLGVPIRLKTTLLS